MAVTSQCSILLTVQCSPHSEVFASQCSGADQAAESEAALVKTSPSSPGAGKEHNTLGYHIKYLPSTRRAFLTHIDELPHLLNCSESEVAKASWDPQLKILGPAFSPESKQHTCPSGKLENPFLGGTPVSAHVRVALEEFLVILRDYRDGDAGIAKLLVSFTNVLHSRCDFPAIVRFQD